MKFAKFSLSVQENLYSYVIYLPVSMYFCWRVLSSYTGMLRLLAPPPWVKNRKSCLFYDFAAYCKIHIYKGDVIKFQFNKFITLTYFYNGMKEDDVDEGE